METISKHQQLTEALTKVEKDMYGYLNEYLLPVLASTDFSEENILLNMFPFGNEPLLKQISHIDKDGKVFLFCCEHKCEKLHISVDALPINVISELIKILEPFTLH